MAPPSFPNGMNLQTIGFAALKYPELHPDVPVPLGNQVGVLQRVPPTQAHHIAQIASQYIDALIEYQTSNDATLQDRSSPQHYFSTALCLLNYLTYSPDVCKRIADTPALLNNIIEQMLEPDYIARMKAVDRQGVSPFPAASFDADFGSVLQFVSTMMLYTDRENLHPRINELVPKLKIWKQVYKSSPIKTIKNASERIMLQVTEVMGSNTTGLVKAQLTEQALVCGDISCSKRGLGLVTCNGCKIQRYYGKEHQKADWKYHKHICKKGLVLPNADGAPSPATAISGLAVQD